ncbi:PEP/pyruvate-binding domain-containing protein [Oceanitalea stevensii]|uniref:Pyruvate kinase n=1 Tax=Oceanitalea stevensii TaxID=2763072 RepID=A0ABR8Z4Q1_9MICO|nr:PEP/pyruvate-binding domain-containing protein [Oceanitalea stevensii]MBD8063325.1 pyruvate kinase [Oceanitalea stevensii]
MRRVVPLEDAEASSGTKAATLSRLARAGVAVPGGIVVREAAADGWEPELRSALRELGGDRFAVRSSALGEDAAQASFAGQLLTRLDVPTTRVAEAVRDVAASVAGAAAYTEATGRSLGEDVAVLVQPMLRPVAAGVAFTRHPVTGARATVVEAVRGLGEPLVSGRAAPQRWQRGSTGGLVASGTPDVLTEAHAEAVVERAEQVEKMLGGAQDVEWALDADGVVWVLQARPVTTDAPALDETAARSARPLVSGTAAGPGTATGPLRGLAGLDDFARFRAGDVLVCRSTAPAWVPVLSRAAAVVTEVGGILAHAAIVARELGIPAVTDVPAATRLPDGALVTVDGTAGTITLLEES